MKVTEAEDIVVGKGTYLIYAPQGVGKTTSLKYLPGKTFVVSIDKSEFVLKGEKNITIGEVDTHDMWNSWMEAVKIIVEEKYDQKYDNIVIDNVSELFRAALANLGREGKNHRVPEQSHYQRVDFVILDSLRALKKLDARLFFTAWESTDLWQSETGQSYNRSMPDIRDKIRNNFLGLCDVVARLSMTTDKDGTEKRGFVLQPTNSVFAKNRLDKRKGCLVDQLVVVEEE